VRPRRVRARRHIPVDQYPWRRRLNLTWPSGAGHRLGGHPEDAPRVCRQVPVPAAKQLHHCRHEDRVHHGRVEQDRHGQAQTDASVDIHGSAGRRSPARADSYRGGLAVERLLTGTRCPITEVIGGNPPASRSGGPTSPMRWESLPERNPRRNMRLGLRASHARGRWFEPSHAHFEEVPPSTGSIGGGGAVHLRCAREPPLAGVVAFA
jgi:hypothetical protein